MRNRFQTNRKPAYRGILLPVVIFVALVGLFFYGVDSVSRVSEREQRIAVEKAITRAVVQCYSAEGQYPPSLAYLEEHYGLALDHEKYIIQYDVFAANIMPSVMVLSRDFEQGEEVAADAPF